MTSQARMMAAYLSLPTSCAYHDDQPIDDCKKCASDPNEWDDDFYRDK